MLKITAKDLMELKVIDEVVPEPLGGAHNNHKEAAESLKTVLVRNLSELRSLTVGDLVDSRYKKFRAIGPYSGDVA